MCPPSKPRPSPRRTARADQASNLAVQLPEPTGSEPELDDEPEDPVPELGEPAEDPSALEPDEPDDDSEGDDEDDPIASGLLAYRDATTAQKERARHDLQTRLSAYLVGGKARVVVTDNLHTMLSVKKGQGVLTFRMHHMYLLAPPEVVRAVARYAEFHDRDATALLRRFVDANEELIRARDRSRPIPIDVQGRYHNLQELFDGLNAKYFDGRIKARITWGPRSKRRRSRASIELGKYVFEDQLIRIHPVLDAKDVPRFFVEWIVYHEMLHEVHGLPVVDGRRVHHSAAFREDEEKFEDHLRAVRWELKHKNELLDR